MTCPVIHAACSELRRATALPTSSGLVNRPIGVHPLSCQARLRSWTSFGNVFNTLSSVRPGLSALTVMRSEEHTSELQSLAYLVCRLLLEKKKKDKQTLERMTDWSTTPVPHR